MFRVWLKRLKRFPKEVVVKLTLDEEKVRIVGEENGKDEDIFEKEPNEETEDVSEEELIIVDLI